MLQDWGLANKKHGFLRSKLMYPNRAVYFIAIFMDLFLRYLWVLSLVPHNSKAPFGSDFTGTLSPFFGVLEILRRTMWGLLRVENEHLNNFEGYRKVKYVPLPFDTETEDGDQGLNKSKESSFVGLLEIALFIVVVLAFGVVAYITKDQ